MTDMHHLHIFLSSPADVSRERQLAQEVIDRLQSERAYRDLLKMEVVAWDKPGAGTRIPAHLEPQEALNLGLKKPSECDVVIVIFWARMGTPLSGNCRKPDGSRYRSGTEYEFLDGLNAAKATNKPEVWVYRGNQAPSVQLDNTSIREKLKQWDLVEEFFAEFRNPDGSYRIFCKEYDESSNFKDLLEQDLRDFITSYFEKHPLDKAEVSIPFEEPTWDPSKAPFPGLRAFTPEDALIFYGRGRETDELIGKISKSNKRFIAVVGASGSGKSSLVAAGLRPALKNNAIYGSEDWVWFRFTPGEVGDNPFMALASAFKSISEGHGHRPRDIAKELETDPDALQDIVSMALKGKPNWAEVVLFIDQFEELFTLVGAKYQRRFVDILARAAQTERIRTLVTMRADFYHRCLELPVLNELLTKGHYPLLAPKIGALYEMITRPAKKAGLQFEEGLEQRILDDTGTEPGALALMAFALFELWDESKGVGRSLTRAAYESFNGVHGAIGKRAETTFKSLEGERTGLEAALTLVFRKLVDVDERGVATRRRARLSQVTNSTAAETLVRAMTDARLLVTSQGERDVAMVEVAHEAIFTNWRRLEAWIEEHASELRTCRSLTRSARDWQEAGAPPFKHLPDRATLKQYRKVRPVCSLGEEDVNVVGRFLGTARRRQALWGGFLALILVVVSIFGVDIWLQNQEMTWNGLHIWARVQVGLYDGPPMMEIPGGAFKMGASNCTADVNPDECPQHSVTIRPLWIGRYEVTFDEYSAFVLDRDDIKMPSDGGYGRGLHPVINVSWEDAQAYAAWLAEVIGKTFRLPTEAEWEYAVRAGTETLFSFGDDKDKLTDYAWFASNSNSKTHRVGQKEPNRWGLYDMHGNVWEWVEDVWHYTYDGAPSDGSAWINVSRGAGRVYRGGGLYTDANGCRSAYRIPWPGGPGNRYDNVGFRLARSVALGS